MDRRLLCPQEARPGLRPRRQRRPALPAWSSPPCSPAGESRTTSGSTFAMDSRRISMTPLRDADVPPEVPAGIADPEEPRHELDRDGAGHRLIMIEARSTTTTTRAE